MMAKRFAARSPRASGRGDFSSRARKIRLLVTDVDGVLTDGRMLLSERGDELKAFHTRDGVAVELARRAGIKTAMVTGESTSIARARGTKLGVDNVVLGARRKADAVDALLAEHGLTLPATAYIGDDLLDVPALRRVGLAVAVADAAPEVKAICHAVTRARGGQGALREVVERILRAQGAWEAVLDGFLRDHGDARGGRRTPQKKCLPWRARPLELSRGEHPERPAPAIPPAEAERHG